MNGEDRLDHQLRQWVERQIAEESACAQGDSPIERLFLRALRHSVQFSISEYWGVLMPEDDAHLQKVLGWGLSSDLVVVRQAQVAGWRVDFLIYAWDNGRVGQPGWRKLIVECDGHDFHERTKEQAARDRPRDRDAQLLGFSIMRFTGSEIHADPLGCALQVSAWASQGF